MLQPAPLWAGASENRIPDAAGSRSCDLVISCIIYSRSILILFLYLVLNTFSSAFYLCIPHSGPAQRRQRSQSCQYQISNPSCCQSSEGDAEAEHPPQSAPPSPGGRLRNRTLPACRNPSPSVSVPVTPARPYRCSAVRAVGFQFTSPAALAEVSESLSFMVLRRLAPKPFSSAAPARSFSSSSLLPCHPPCLVKCAVGTELQVMPTHGWEDT